MAGTVALAQQSARKVAKIEVEGLERLSADEVIATSGLKVGAVFSVKDIDVAAQRLMDSGLFAKVNYRTTGRGNQVTVIFQVKEIGGGQSPVVFDNFVWFTDDELNAAIKREVPSYAGTASDAGRMTDDIKQALQNLLKEHQIEGTVEYAPELAGLNSDKQEHLYSVSGAHIPICSLHFPGASNVPEVKLVMSSKQLVEQAYSKKTAIAFSTFILFPIYRQAGQLKAKFGLPVTKLESSTNCKGIELSIPVQEGPIYLWNKSEWVGNDTVAASDLADALGMHKGEVANGAKIDKGLVQVAQTYGHTGHLEARVNGEPEFDDASNQVSYKMTVVEGPQFKMGTLTIKGLEETDANALSGRWKLRNGEVFDSSYSDRFFRIDAREVMERIMAARAAQRKGEFEVHIKPNQLNLNADVTIEFKP